ncbi:MAG: hypothetical protein ACREAN_00770 [Nitrosopumilaceae archaeon]
MGNTQWITSTVSVCGAKAGEQEVMMDYWYTTTTNAYGTEYWFLSYAQHTAEGFHPAWYCDVFVPTVDTEYINAEHNTFAGQILASWDPVNTGNSNPIQYSIGISPSGPTASVTYLQSGVPISWSTSGDPGGSGTLTWTNNFGGPFQPSKANVLFYTLPSAVLELDPQFSGGFLPFDDQNTFNAIFCSQTPTGGCGSVYIYPSAISFYESIWTNSISYTG